MSNMSYCRWQNTASDLLDCAGSIEDSMNGAADNDEGEPEPLSRDEKVARSELFHTMIDMLEQIGVSHDIDSHELDKILEQLP
jgi:hypothetical protein